MSQIKERPILFNGDMVRALLEGRKGVTRRAVKSDVEELIRCHAGEPGEEADVSFIYGTYLDDDRQEQPAEWLVSCDECPEEGVIPLGQCPYGKPGDRLWVRESFSGPYCMEASEGCAAAPPSKWGRFSRIWYWADGDPGEGDWTRPRPSIHMPRWASRILLEITDVRVERLQEISEADAESEGVSFGQITDQATGETDRDACEAFEQLWESINGAGSWESNPWVWVVKFKRIEPQEQAA